MIFEKITHSQLRIFLKTVLYCSIAWTLNILMMTLAQFVNNYTMIQSGSKNFFDPEFATHVINSYVPLCIFGFVCIIAFAFSVISVYYAYTFGTVLVLLTVLYFQFIIDQSLMMEGGGMVYLYLFFVWIPLYLFLAPAVHFGFKFFTRILAVKFPRRTIQYALMGMTAVVIGFNTFLILV